ncbi:hypothetical protein ACFRMQ_40295 [Kitasatospora sp. NPDC056783]|uniref:hypothetical protein n=1 Tax=Kitasatospora sp. NPDC056783 TaxID=3345943 RepID=UPI0036B9A5CE
MAIQDCATRRTLVERLAADYRSLDETTTGTEKELVALQAESAAPETIAAVQERLAEERERLGEITLRGRVAVEEFRAACGDEQLSTPPWPPR